MARIAVVHVPLFSHLEAATRLCSILAEQGHELIAFGPEWARASIEASGARFELHDTAMPSAPTFVGHAVSIAAMTELLAGDLIERIFDYEVDLVIHDSLVLWGRVAAEHLGLPRVVTHPMYPVIAPFRIRSDNEPASVDRPDPEVEWAEFEERWRSIARRWGVEIGRPSDVVHSTAGSDATVLFTTEEIVGDTFDYPPNWHCIGPLLEPAPPVAPRGERPLVYACFGTCFNRRKRLFEAVIEGLADEPVDVLISTGKRGASDDEVVSAADLGPLPPNMEARDFVDAREVLSRAAVHITHGGNNSVHESLLAGVPMLLIPQAFDQAPLAGRLSNLGAGRITKDRSWRIRDDVRSLLGDASVTRRAHELARHLAGYDSEARVAGVFERVLSERAVVGA